MAKEMPADIDPQSTFRLPLLKREELDEAGQRAFDRANTPGKTIVGLRGPSGIHLYSTKTIDAHNVMNQHLRFQGFDAKTREIAILTVAREMDSRFEWAAHEPEALKEGVAPEVVISVRVKFSKNIGHSPNRHHPRMAQADDPVNATDWQCCDHHGIHRDYWMPAFAGMTMLRTRHDDARRYRPAIRLSPAAAQA